MTIARVIDTSYLVELFRVPGHFDPTFAVLVYERFKNAIKGGDRLYVPVPVVFEVADHIAHVDDGGARHAIATKFVQSVRTSAETAMPWVIPRVAQDVLVDVASLLECCDAFAKEFVVQSVRLSDASVIREARRLKDKYNDANDRVFIWAKDKGLKAHEPDDEPDALVR